jgi:hypothetical protein
MWGLRQHTLLGIVVSLMWGLGQDTLLGIVVGLWALGNTLYWVLLWFMSLRQYFTGYCCWFMWGLGQQTLLGIVDGYVAPQATHFTGYCCGFMRGLGQHTSLGIVVGYVAPQATHFTGYCCWFMRGLGQHTLLPVGIVVGYARFWATHFTGHQMRGTFINGFKIILFLSNSRKVDVSVSVSPPKLLKQISPHKQNHMALLSCFPINLYKHATIRQISYS